MPGLNQRGPMNEGPMTGGARGLCSRRIRPDAQMAGYGRGRGRGSGICRWGSQSRNAGDGYSTGEPSLQERIETLESELADARAQLKNNS